MDDKSSEQDIKLEITRSISQMKRTRIHNIVMGLLGLIFFAVAPFLAPFLPILESRESAQHYVNYYSLFMAMSFMTGMSFYFMMSAAAVARGVEIRVLQKILKVMNKDQN